MPKTQIYKEPNYAKVVLHYGDEMTSVEVDINTLAKRNIISAINDLIGSLSVMKVPT